MGRHGRPEPDALAGVDVAADLESGPVIDIAPAAQKASTAEALEYFVALCSQPSG